MDRERSSNPELLAALVLGRIQAGITRATEGALQILAARSIRESLIAALRQEGHEFTESRFFAWYAGLDTLSAPSPADLRPPNAICRAILTELRHGAWPLLASAAETLQRAFMAPEDFNSGTDHEDAHDTIAAARQLIAALDVEETGLPFQPVASLHAAAANSVPFARQECDLDLTGGRATDRHYRGNSRWALDLLAGGYLTPRHGLPIALPMPGLVALPLARPEGDEDEDDGGQASVVNLYDALDHLDRWLGEAEADVAIIGSALANRRSSGRAGHLATYLAGFGPLRGAQIEQVIGVSRPGARVVTSTLEASSLVQSHPARNAARLYSFAPTPRDRLSTRDDRSAFQPSSGAIAEYEESMRALDELLSRSTFGGGQE